MVAATNRAVGLFGHRVHAAQEILGAWLLRAGEERPGGGVFQNALLTMDYPGQRLVIAPYPAAFAPPTCP